MRRFKKIMAAFLAGALIVGSVGVMPATEAAATEETSVSYVTEDDIIRKYNLDEKITINNDSNSVSFQSTAAKQTIADGEGYIYLPGKISGSNNILFNFRDDDHTTGVLWMTMDVMALQTDANITIRIADDVTSMTTENKYAQIADLKMTKDVKHTISCKVDLTNDKFYIFLDGVQQDDGVAYKGEKFNRCRVTLSGNADNTVDEEALRIDNVAVYVSENEVDVFGTPTKLVLDSSSITLANVNDTQQLIVGVDTGIVPDSVAWESSNTKVATVSSSGEVVAKKAGEAVITASADGITGATCKVIIGVDDLLLVQDFDNETPLGAGGLEFSTGTSVSTKVPADSTSILKKSDTDGTNQYLYLTAGTEQNRVNIHFPNEYEDGVIWVEMHVLKVGSPWKINMYANGTSVWNAQKSFLGVIYGSNIKTEDTQDATSYGSLSEESWVKLSYKITLGSVPGKCEAYVNDVYQYTVDYKAAGANRTNPLKTCQMLSIIVEANSGADPTTTGIKIDDIAVYRNNEQVDFFAPEIQGTTLSLDGNIGVNFHTDINNRLVESKNTYMKLTLPNKNNEEVQINFSDVEKDTTTGYYVFKGEVAAKDMTGDIKVEMFEGSRQLIEPVNFTVYDNATYIIDNSVEGADDYDEKYADAAPLVKALLNYGAYAQTYFGVKTDALANASLTSEEKDVSSVTAEQISDAIEKGAVEGTSDEVSIYGVSIDLKSQTALNYYFKLADTVNIDSFTFKIGSETITPEKTGSMYCIKKSDINALDLGTIYKVDVTRGGESVSSVSYSALQYAYNVLNASEGTDLTGKGKMSELQNVVKALYKYHVEAETYQNSQSVSN